VAIDLADDKLDLARRLGATATVNASSVDAVEAVREVTGGKGVDVAFEALGSPATVETAIDVVDDGGRAVLVGIAPVGSLATFDITRVVRRTIRILGSYGARARTDMPLALDLVARGLVHVDELITDRFPLEETARAYEALDNRRVVGRAIIEMSESR
jgi:succinate semialdehyde reductase (NADPH)